MLLFGFEAVNLAQRTGYLESVGLFVPILRHKAHRPPTTVRTALLPPEVHLTTRSRRKRNGNLPVWFIPFYAAAKAPNISLNSVSYVYLTPRFPRAREMNAAEDAVIYATCSRHSAKDARRTLNAATTGVKEERSRIMNPPTTCFKAA